VSIQDFDNLTAALAYRVLSRRSALGLMGAALLGGTLASIPGTAQARPHSCVQGFTPREPGTHCNVMSGGVQLYCCSTKKLITCCRAGEVCCIRQSRPQCVSSSATCEDTHGQQGDRRHLLRLGS